jgi:hypothetical protein
VPVSVATSQPSVRSACHANHWKCAFLLSPFTPLANPLRCSACVGRESERCMGPHTQTKTVFGLKEPANQRLA